MKLIHITCLFLAITGGIHITAAQTTPAANAPTTAPANRQRRPVELPDANAPSTKYDYSAAFAPFFYTKKWHRVQGSHRRTGPKILAKPC